MDSILKGNYESIDDYLKVCAVIKFWSSLVLLRDVELNSLLESFNVLNRLNDFLSIKGREEIIIHSLTFIGNLGSHKAGLEIILNHKLLLDSFSRLYQVATNHLKSASMQTLSCVLERDSLDPQDSLLCKTFYESFPSCINDIQHYWKNPFDEMRYSAYALLKGIVSHPWGIPIIANHSIFGLMLDRSTETSLIGMVI